MKNLGAIYTEEWLRHHETYRDEFRALAEVIDETFAPFDSVLDVGCGASITLERLAELGHDVGGIDGSPFAREVAPAAVRDRVIVARIEDSQPGVLPADLVVCTEVAEHVEAEHADRLVWLLANSARGAIYFTAAPPGQGGTDHVNEQPLPYWLTKFAKYGFALDEPRSIVMRAKLRERLRRMTWYAGNSVVLLRAWPAR